MDNLNNDSLQSSLEKLKNKALKEFLESNNDVKILEKNMGILAEVKKEDFLNDLQ